MRLVGIQLGSVAARCHCGVSYDFRGQDQASGGQSGTEQPRRAAPKRSNAVNYYNYFTEIEEHFVRRRGKSLLVSPMDWSLITTWRDSGVPLHVALRGIDIAMNAFFSGSRRATERPGTLFYCYDAVMAEYARYLEAHIGEAAPAGGGEAPAGGSTGQARDGESSGDPGKDQVIQFMAARISEIKSVREKHSLRENAAEALERVLARLGDLTSSAETSNQIKLEDLERDLGILDELMITELREEISKEQMSDWEQEAKKELKVYKKRLPTETYQKIRDNFIRGKIHRYFNLGELSLFHL